MKEKLSVRTQLQRYIGGLFRIGDNLINIGDAGSGQATQRSASQLKARQQAAWMTSCQRCGDMGCSLSGSELASVRYRGVSVSYAS